MFITPRELFDFKPIGNSRVRLQGDLEYLDNKCGHIYVPDGFECDLASYGRILRSIYDRLGPSMRPAVIHDFLYATKVKGISRADADRIFRHGLLLDGASKVSAWTQWIGVRKAGWLFF